jgi:hypothetical protein
VRALGELAVDVVFLHCYPYHREAAYLAAVFPHVYFDVGLALHYTGPAAGQVLTEAMELAPFTKQLYSSDAFALAEFHYLGALLFAAAWQRSLRTGCVARSARRPTQTTSPDSSAARTPTGSMPWAMAEILGLVEVLRTIGQMAANGHAHSQ